MGKDGLLVLRRGFLNSALWSPFVLLNLILICDGTREGTSDLTSSPAINQVIDVSMPNVRPKKDDDYYCTAKNIESYGTQYIHKYEPNSDADRAHHMLLFACNDVREDLTRDGWWDCGHHYQACTSMRIAYAWAKNAPPTEMPPEVGFRIGVESNIKFLVLQVHYAHKMPVNSTDSSGFRIHVSSEEPKFLAGVMILFRSYLTIPGNTEVIHGDSNCPLSSDRPIHPFAYRVHTHKLGKVVTGYVYNATSGFRKIGKGNPQWPQAFYPIAGSMQINPTEIVVARCTYSTLGFESTTRIGSTAGDEMCNLYIMFYTDSRDPEAHYIDCGDEAFPQVSQAIPVESDVPLPRNRTLEEHAMGHAMHSTANANAEVAVLLGPLDKALDVKKKNHAKKRPGTEYIPDHSEPSIEDKHILDGRLDADRQIKSRYEASLSWPKESIHLGQTSGVDFDLLGNVVVFHRADRKWEYDTFDNENNFMKANLGPINTDTVYVVSPVTGEILHQWGKNLFYLPHDITVAPNGDTFLTDVALHQVFRFSPGSTSPNLVLGERFVHGKDDSHFCKPAAVAAMKNGDFFVADGYCNSRLVKFNKNGQKILEVGRAFQPSLTQRLFNQPPPAYAFYVPHALALAEEQDLICVADRENGRIQCFTASTMNHLYTISSRLFGGRLFSVAYSDVDGGTLYAVNGPSSPGVKVQGFVIPLRTKSVSSVFSPKNQGFNQPHDIAVTKNGSHIYVTEIAPPYRLWQFHDSQVAPVFQHGNERPAISLISPQPSEPERRINPGKKQGSPVTSSGEGKSEKNSKLMIDEDTFSTSVIIMAFLTIPLLLFIGIGALLRLRSNGCCKRSKEFAEFFPPSAGFEKLRMDETESDNSDTEVEEFTVSSYKKARA